MPYERKTTDIFITPELADLLTQFRSHSVIADALLQKRLSKEIVHDNHINYLSLSKDDLKISYLPFDRINKYKEVIENEPQIAWKANLRIKANPGSAIQKVFKNLNNKDIEVFVNYFKALQAKKEYEMKIVSGPDIRKYYFYNSYKQQSGSLGNSCMKYDGCASFFSLYEENDDTIKMLIMSDPSDKIYGRALLWHVGDVKVMDRIYTINDEEYSIHFKKWAEQNGYIFKTHQKFDHTLQFDENGKTSEKRLSVKLNNSKFDLYPYLDTFKFLNRNDGVLYNYNPIEDTEEPFGCDNNISILMAPNGSYYGSQHIVFDHIDRKYLHKGDAVFIKEKNFYTNTGNCNWSNTNDRYILKDISFFCEVIGDHFLNERELNNQDRLDYHIKRYNWDPFKKEIFEKREEPVRLKDKRKSFFESHNFATDYNRYWTDHFADESSRQIHVNPSTGVISTQESNDVAETSNTIQDSAPVQEIDPRVEQSDLILEQSDFRVIRGGGGANRISARWEPLASYGHGRVHTITAEHRRYPPYIGVQPRAIYNVTTDVAQGTVVDNLSEVLDYFTTANEQPEPF